MADLSEYERKKRNRLIGEVKSLCEGREGLTAGQSKGLDRLLRWKVLGVGDIDAHALSLIGSTLQSEQFDASYIRAMRNATKLSEAGIQKIIAFLKLKCDPLAQPLKMYSRVCDSSVEIEAMYNLPTEAQIVEVKKEIEVERQRGRPKKLFFSHKTPSTYDEVLEQVLADDSNDDLFKGLHNLIKIQFRRFEGLISRSMENPQSVTEKDIDSCAESIRKTWDTLGKFQIAADLLKTQKDQLADNVRNSYSKYMQNFDEDSRKSVGAGVERMLGWLQTRVVDKEPAVKPVTIDVGCGGEE